MLRPSPCIQFVVAELQCCAGHGGAALRPSPYAPLGQTADAPLHFIAALAPKRRRTNSINMGNTEMKTMPKITTS